jgi:transmembrane sensor
MTEPDSHRPDSALDWAAAPDRADLLLAELRARARRRRRRRARALVGAATLLLAGALWLWPARPSGGDLSPQPAIVHAPARQVLPDGSVVELRDDARLNVDFSPTLRRVTLVRGEAHFAVAKNPARPFVVTAAGMEVRAVGTAFAVQVGSVDLAVLVTEGRVALAQPSAAAAPIAILEVGNRAVLRQEAAARDAAAPAATITALAPVEMEQHLDWRVPRLEFSGTRLGEAVQLFNRYSARRLSLADTRLAELQVSGIVRADNADALLQLLAANYQVIVRDAGPAGYVLERKL